MKRSSLGFSWHFSVMLMVQKVMDYQIHSLIASEEITYHLVIHFPLFCDQI